MRLALSLTLFLFLAGCGLNNHYAEYNTEKAADRLARVDYSLQPKLPPRPSELGYLNLLKRKSQLLDETEVNYDPTSPVGQALNKKIEYVRAYDNTELFTFLSMLFSDTGVVLKYGPGVKLDAPITVDFRKAKTVKEVLDGALTTLDYRYRVIDSKTIEILAYETLEVYLRMPNSQFNYQVQITNGSFKTEEGQTETIPTGADINFTTTSTSANGGGGRTQNGAVVSFWQDLSNTLKSLVSQKGKFSVSSSTGAVLITDTPSSIRRISRYLQGVADDLGKQAIIEVSVMEVGFSEKNTKGIQWKQVFDRLGSSTIGSIKYAPEPLTEASKSMIEFTLLNSEDNYQVLIQALREQGDVSIVSKPKVLALNHLPVIIQGGRFISYVKKVETTSQNDSGSVNFTAEPGSILNGLTLFIHPTISENEVALNLTPVVSRLVDMKTVQFGGSSGVLSGSNGITMELPTVSVQTMNTSARVKNGEVLIIGGLLSDASTNKQNGLPYLSRVPVVGKALSWITDSTSEEVQRREIVITLTPKILAEPAAYLEIRRI